jgi:hypothetical protein
MSDDFLEERRHALEEQFFRKQNDEKLAALRTKLSEENTHVGLRRASGMSNDEVLEKLAGIGMTGQTVAALSLVPLVHVAWADNKMQDEERAAILRAAEGKQIANDSDAYAVLESWLDEQPPEDLFTAWREYIKALGGELLNEHQFANLKTQILGFARGVAESAGGFLGIHKVADSEEKALGQIEDSFNL